MNKDKINQLKRDLISLNIALEVSKAKNKNTVMRHVKGLLKALYTLETGKK